MGRVLNDINLLRHTIVDVARPQAGFMSSGERGDWGFEFAIGGLSDERRQVLAQALNAKNKAKGLPPAGDGWLHTSGVATGVSLAVASTMALAEIGGQLRDVGFSKEELVASDFRFEVLATGEPTEVPELRGLRKRLLSHAHGMAVSSANLFDMGTRQKLGDRTYKVEGAITGLSDFAAVAVEARLREMGASGGAPITHGSIRLEIITEQVGSGYGALLLAMRKFARLFEVAPSSASLFLTATEIN